MLMHDPAAQFHGGDGLGGPTLIGRARRGWNVGEHQQLEFVGARPEQTEPERGSWRGAPAGQLHRSRLRSAVLVRVLAVDQRLERQVGAGDADRKVGTPSATRK